MKTMYPFKHSVAITSLVASLLCLGGVGSAGAVDLTAVSWGGAFTAAQQKALHNPFMRANPDVKILNDDSGGQAVAKIRAASEAGNVSFDVVTVIPQMAIQLCDEGLVVEFDHDSALQRGVDGSKPTEDFGAFINSNCLAPSTIYSTTFGYRHDKLRRAPKSIRDVFNTVQFPGKRSLIKQPITNMEWALIANGVKAEDVYDVLDTPRGVARAFAMLDTIKDQVVWWTQGAQPAQLLADGEVTIASGYNGRLFSAIVEENQPISMMWDHQILDWDGWVIPIGAPNMKEAREFVRFATDSRRLANMTQYISYSPTRQSSAPLIGQHAELGIDMGPHMPLNPKNAKRVVHFNHAWWADNEDDLNERFNAWLSR